MPGLALMVAWAVMAGRVGKEHQVAARAPLGSIPGGIATVRAEMEALGVSEGLVVEVDLEEAVQRLGMYLKMGLSP
jgi:hypothetical protein